MVELGMDGRSSRKPLADDDTSPRQLNVKDSDTHRLAGELARRRQISVAAAVKAALTETLAREPIDDSEARLERVRELTRGLRDLWTDQRSSKEIMDSLYDEFGAPI